MDKQAKIYVAGHHGLVGSAIWNNLKQKGYTNLVGKSHNELDLQDGVAVRNFFDAEQPDCVILAAAHAFLKIVGGEDGLGQRRGVLHRSQFQFAEGSHRRFAPNDVAVVVVE